MIRTTIYLPEKLHNVLRHLAVEKKESTADLLRQTAEKVYERDIKDMRIARKAWRDHLNIPERSISARDYFAGRKDV